MRNNLSITKEATRESADKGMVLLIARSQTTTLTLAAITYRLLADPASLSRLRTEVEKAMPGPTLLSNV